MLKRYRYLLILAAVTAVFLAIHIVGALAAATEPGTDEDPIVSQSYVDQKIQEINEQLAEATAQQIKEIKDQLAGVTAQKFVVVENLEAGKKLIADESTEIILRTGSVSAITSKAGGLSDVTAGKNIAEGEPVPKDHLIIIPRTDGRGVKAVEKSILMVKGTFRIE